MCGRTFSKFHSLRRHVDELHKGVRPEEMVGHLMDDDEDIEEEEEEDEGNESS